jgi:hypothetical protein
MRFRMWLSSHLLILFVARVDSSKTHSKNMKTVGKV